MRRIKQGDVIASEGSASSLVSSQALEARVDRASGETLQDMGPHSPLDATTEQRPGGPRKGEDTWLGARRCLGPPLIPQAL